MPPLAKLAMIRLYGLLRDVLRGVGRVFVKLVRLRGLSGRQAQRRRRDADQQDHAFHGSYLQFIPPVHVAANMS